MTLMLTLSSDNKRLTFVIIFLLSSFQRSLKMTCNKPDKLGFLSVVEYFLFFWPNICKTNEGLGHFNKRRDAAMLTYNGEHGERRTC